MASTRFLLFALVALVCGQAFAQTDQADQNVSDQNAQQPAPRNRAIVYKCAGANGSVVYSENPCSTDPKKVQEIDTSGALKTGSGGHLRDIAAGVADNDCRSRARQAAYGNLGPDLQASNDHIADYQQRAAKAAEQKVYAPDGSGNLIDDPNAQQTIADLDALIAQEREFQRKANENAEVTFQNGARGCDEQAAAMEASKKAEPPPAQKPQPQQDSGQQ
ncbi:MAG TPA: hypothetical protein VFE67_10155 [Rudaea sp.]|jgi:hypothetical protein|nr:hypothetical protein [Rudaea sp.]